MKDLGIPLYRGARKSDRPNTEGLTLEEWCQAAGRYVPHYHYQATKKQCMRHPSIRVSYAAWERGEDPTEYRKC